MSAKLVAITQPLEVFDGVGEPRTMTVEEFLAYVARVSNPENQNNTLTAKKLLQYLVKNKHWSPFEMVHLVQEINTTRDIARQILRHRSFAFQEFSQRYADPTKMEFHMREARLQDRKNRQNSIEVDDKELQDKWWAKQEFLIEKAKDAYHWAIDNGIAKEQARVVLPEGLTASRLYMAGSLRSWITYIALREKNGTQKEHRQIALECKKNIIEHFPSFSIIGSNEEGEWII